MQILVKKIAYIVNSHNIGYKVFSTTAFINI